MTDVATPVLLIETALALVVPRLRLAAPPVSILKVVAPPLVTLRAPPAVKLVLVPKLTVPLPACRVRLPATVLQVAAVALVRVSAPAVVVKLDAALPVSDTAPPDTLIPALPVILPVKVLAPAKLCAEVLTIPTLVASAVCKYMLVPLITAPLLLLV